MEFAVCFVALYLDWTSHSLHLTPNANNLFLIFNKFPRAKFSLLEIFRYMAKTETILFCFLFL